MLHNQQHEDDPEVAALIKRLDEAHSDLRTNGPISADQLDRNIEAVYERHRRDVEQDAIKARNKVG